MEGIGAAFGGIGHETECVMHLCEAIGFSVDTVDIVRQGADPILASLNLLIGKAASITIDNVAGPIGRCDILCHDSLKTY
jgi:hypothetical protein